MHVIQQVYSQRVSMLFKPQRGSQLAESFLHSWRQPGKVVRKHPCVHDLVGQHHPQVYPRQASQRQDGGYLARQGHPEHAAFPHEGQPMWPVGRPPGMAAAQLCHTYQP